MAPTGKHAIQPPKAGSIAPQPSLLPVPSNAALPGDKLCAACSSLDLTARRFIVFPTDSEFMQWAQPSSANVVLQPVAQTRKNTNCPLCRLLLVSLSGGLIELPDIDRQGRKLQVALRWGTTGRTPSSNEPWAFLSEVRFLYPSLVLDGGKFPDLPLQLPFFPEINLLANDLPPDASPTLLRFLHRPGRPDSIDIDLARRQLSLCEARHGAACSSARTMQLMDWTSPALAVPDFRCVDLEQNCLVRLRDVAEMGCGDQRYAALSYVWGRADSDGAFFETVAANVDERSVPHFFAREENRARIPRTIRDAMAVTRKLGLRYMWVDSLCIVQGGSGERWLEALRKMDNVYGAAHVVICAAASRDAFAGIVNVESGRGPWGNVRTIEQIGEGFRLGFAHTEFLPEDRAYDTRGWTYQEKHFASRTLMLEGGTARLHCRSGLSFGESEFEDTSVITKPPGSSFGSDNDIGEIEGLIQNYSGRQFTVESDVLRAFAGVGRQMRRQLQCDMCHGLPTAFFDWFLLWKPPVGGEDQPPLCRRSVAPSWSWAGWRGGVFPHIWDWYTRDMHAVRRGIRKRTWILWHQRLDHASTRCVLLGLGKIGAETKISRNFYGGPHRKDQRFPGIDCRVTDPTPRTLAHAENLPQYTHDLTSECPGSGLLQFWTISAVFELRLFGAGDDGVYGKSRKPPNRTGILSASESLNSSESADVANHDEDGDLGRLLGGGEDGDVDDFDMDKQPGVKVIIGGKYGQAVGKIYVPEWWEGLASLDSGGPHEYEFIVLCEARDQRSENPYRADDDEGWRYRVMLAESKCDGQYFERVAIGSVGRDDLGKAVRPMEWKEFVLG